ncbi:MAG: ribonuclease III [Rhizobiales bacterium]|nr:ribonuclease III [Hyphomicrobiales bacterium]
MGEAVSLEQIAERLGYRFRDERLLQRALTHASARSGSSTETDNERLEFLGDRVLGLAVAELLMARFPHAAEGDLAKRLNRLVRRETCARVAYAIDLGNALRLGGSEMSTGGRRKETIVADACEAVLGAVFIDGGYGPARDIVARFWVDLIDEMTETPADAKSELQEWAQGLGRPLPSYRAIGRSGPDHAPQFVTEVRVEGVEPARGSGRSKRIAEHEAAAALLMREGVWPSGKDIPDE